jgi:predicted dehydrogenase
MTENNVQSKPILKGAMLGAGQVAPYQLKAWQSIGGVEIAAIANRTISKAKSLAEQFGIDEQHVYGDYRELLEKEDIDFVDVATAPHVHREQVEACARYGLPVLCQKPFATSVGDAWKMIDACDREGVLLSINENWRWRSWYRQVKSHLDAGKIGVPRYSHISRHTNITLPGNGGELPELFKKQSYLLDMDKLILFEWGIHLIDVLRYFFGEIHSLYARMDKVAPVGRGEDRALVVMNFKKLTSVLDISWSTINGEAGNSQLEKVCIQGDGGTIKLSPHRGDILEIVTKTERVQQPAYQDSSEQAYQDSYTSAQRHFVECLRSGRRPETEGLDNIKTLIATFAAYESARENRVVEIQPL